MRTILSCLSLLLLVSPAAPQAQSFLVRGAAGPTLNDRGVSVTAGAGFSPTSRLTLAVDVERTHLFSRLTSDGRGGFAGFRGGTLTLAAPELRVSVFPSDRVGPYGLIGFAAGVSHPNVNAQFPTPVTNDVRAVFFGGGISVPVNRSLSIVADGRMMVGAEAGELLALAPVRAGVSWRF
jgi:hypothetical protein